MDFTPNSHLAAYLGDKAECNGERRNLGSPGCLLRVSSSAGFVSLGCNQTPLLAGLVQTNPQVWPKNPQV